MSSTSDPLQPSVERPAPSAVPALQGLLGVAVSVALWLGYARANFPGLFPAVDAAAALGVALLAALIIAWSWHRAGGYRNFAALHRWVRGGPKPTQVDAAARVRYLKPLAAKSVGRGWLYVALGGLWTFLAVLQTAESDSHRFGYWGAAAISLISGGTDVLFVKRWNTRVTELVHESRAEGGAADQGPAAESEERR